MGAKLRIPTRSLLGQVDPLSGQLWGCTRIDRTEVLAAAEAGVREERPWDTVKEELQGPDGRAFHIARIATFLQDGLPIDEHSVVLDLQDQPDGLPIGVLNGNHRLAAALLGDEPHVDALVYYFDPADLDRLISGWTPAPPRSEQTDDA